MPEKDFISRLNNFKIRYLTGHRFLYILAVIVGLGVGLAAVIIKNLVHFIREALENGFQGDIQQVLHLHSARCGDHPDCAFY